jgi:hypothetical protein
MSYWQDGDLPYCLSFGDCLNDQMSTDDDRTQCAEKKKSARELYRQSDRRFSAKLVPTFADRGASHGKRNGSPWPYSQISRPGPLLFLPSSSSIVLKRLCGRRSRPTTSQKIW